MAAAASTDWATTSVGVHPRGRDGTVIEVGRVGRGLLSVWAWPRAILGMTTSGWA
jgi:hypothetical protein